MAEEEKSVEEIKEENQRMRDELRARPLRRDDDDGGGKKGGGFNLWTMVLTVALSVIVVVIAAQMGYIGGVEQDFVDYVNTNFALKSDIPAIPDMTQYVSESDLEAYATTADLESYVTLDDLDDVTAPDLSGYATKTQYDALLDRVEDLEAYGGGGSGGGGATDGLVTCELKAYSSLAVPNTISKYDNSTATFTVGENEVVGIGTVWNEDMIGGVIKDKTDGSWYLITAVTDATHLTIGTSYTGGIDGDLTYQINLPTDYQFKATLTNTGSHDLEDVVFVFSITDISYYAGFGGEWTLTSDYFGWEQWGFATAAPVFRSQLWGFSMDAGEEITIYPTLSLALTQAPTYSVMFDVTMECEDYDIVD